MLTAQALLTWHPNSGPALANVPKGGIAHELALQGGELGYPGEDPGRVDAGCSGNRLGA